MGRNGKAKPGIDHRQAQAVRLPSHVTPCLLQALHNTRVSVIYQDADLRVVWARNLPPEWRGDIPAGARDSDLLPVEQAERLTAEKRLVLSTGKAARFLLAIPDAEEPRWFDFWIDADKGTDGSVRGIVTTVVDGTDQRRREQTLKVLLREVSHRSKNLLAIIQSIATQTGRYCGSIDIFLARFRGRLQSLASSQDLVTSSNWRGADLRDLVLGQVGRYTPDPAKSIVFEGARPYLNPNAALHIGLALHELAVNSVSYGALSRPGGTVVVSASLADGEGSRALTLRWSEAAAPTRYRQPEKRFGSVALERVVPSSLGGTADLRLENDRLDYRLIVPAANFEND